jgi:tetratricopeptide (TPR) repeat protein
MWKYITFFTCIGACFLCAEEDFYLRKEQLESSLQAAQGEKRAALLVELATLYMQDQKEEEAFTIFLSALSGHTDTPYTLSKQEQQVYEESLKIYLTQPPQEVAKELQEKLLLHVKRYPTHAYIQLLLAATYANCRQYSAFFDHFSKGHAIAPNSFLAYKTLGIIHIKLFEKARTPEEKEQHRLKLMEYLTKALDYDDRDPMLYKLLIVYGQLEKKKSIIVDMLDRICKGQVVIPRGEIPFYVHEAIEVDEQEKAKQFLNKATMWYQYSRTIEEMKRVLDDNKARS